MTTNPAPHNNTGTPTANNPTTSTSASAADTTTTGTDEQCTYPGHTDDDHDNEHPGHGYMSEKERYIRRMKRIEGQARGITKMIENEKYCVDILTQISALTKALQAVGLGLLDDHLNHCVVNAATAGGEEAHQKIQEASQAIARLVKS